MNTQVAQTIIEQLGPQFSMMTGVRTFVAGENGVKFRIGKNASKANLVKITLNGKDLYDVEFIKHRNRLIPAKKLMSMSVEDIRAWYEPKTLKVYNDIFCDQLQEIFTEYTHLYTRLF